MIKDTMHSLYNEVYRAIDENMPHRHMLSSYENAKIADEIEKILDKAYNLGADSNSDERYELEDQVEELESEKSDLEKEVSKLEDKIDELTEENKAFMEEVEGLRKELKETLQELNYAQNMLAFHEE